MRCVLLLLLLFLPHHAHACLYRFLSYNPSPFEASWARNILRWQHNVSAVCRSKEQRATFIGWVGALARLRVAGAALPPAIFSRFTYQKVCGANRPSLEEVMIEPLAGLTRHPFFVLYGPRYVVHKDHMYVNFSFAQQRLTRSSRANLRTAEKVLHPPGKRRYFLFDFGASLFDEGVGGSSQSWFVKEYEGSNVSFDGIYAYESMNYPPSEVFRRVPVHLIPRYHYANVFVSADPASPNYAIAFIKKIAAPSDYVVMKLDIDNNSVEEGIVQGMLQDPAAGALIDELFWEHHVNVAEMQSYWKMSMSNRTLFHTYALFAQLRQKGIRAHSWV